MRYALIYIIASQLVSLQDVFHLAVQFSKYKSGFRSFGLLSLPSALRSLKTIQVQEEEQSFDLPWQDFFASFGFCSFELLTAFAAIDLE